MNLEQATTIVKQVLDASLRMGVIQNLEANESMLQAWKIILENLNKVNNNGK